MKTDHTPLRQVGILTAHIWVVFKNLAENLSQFRPEMSAQALPPKIPG